MFPCDCLPRSEAGGQCLQSVLDLVLCVVNSALALCRCFQHNWIGHTEQQAVFQWVASVHDAQYPWVWSHQVKKCGVPQYYRPRTCLISENHLLGVDDQANHALPWGESLECSWSSRKELLEVTSKNILEKGTVSAELEDGEFNTLI